MGEKTGCVAKKMQSTQGRIEKTIVSNSASLPYFLAEILIHPAFLQNSREVSDEVIDQVSDEDIAVEVQHDVGPPLMVALDRDLFHNHEVVLLRIVPVDEMNRLGDLSRVDLDGHAVTQQVVDGLIVAVERAVGVVGLGSQLEKGTADLRRRVAALGQPGREQRFFDVAVAVSVGPVAEIARLEFIAEESNDAVPAWRIRVGRYSWGLPWKVSSRYG